MTRILLFAAAFTVYTLKPDAYEVLKVQEPLRKETNIEKKIWLRVNDSWMG